VHLHGRAREVGGGEVGRTGAGSGKGGVAAGFGTLVRVEGSGEERERKWGGYS